MEPAAMVQELAAIVGESAVRSGPAVAKVYDSDAYTVDRSAPSCVVLPASTEEVAAVVKWCNRAQVPFTARGAGTGLSGGAIPACGGVILSTKRLTRILEINVEGRWLRAQTGVTNQSLTDAVASDGLHFAPDPSSQTVSTLGGNIAENAGGPHTLKYGVTAGHILEVVMVDPVGDLIRLGGEVQGAPGLDFLGLVVGGEGTLGVVTEATVKLTPTPKVIQTALAAFPTVRGATESVSAIISNGVIPAALEIMDFGILRALKAAFGLQYPEGTQALLLVECDGDDAATVTAEMDAVREVCEGNGVVSFELALDEKERKRLWTARKKGVGAMGRLAPTVVTHDGVLPRSKLPEMLETVYEVAARYNLNVANIFHAGDGNLHPCFYFDEREDGTVERVVAAGEVIMRRCLELGGSITGEHGVGLEKIGLMEEMFGGEGIRLQKLVKSVFNDGTLCNPCKILPDQKGCTEHVHRLRGVAW